MKNKNPGCLQVAPGEVLSVPSDRNPRQAELVNEVPRREGVSRVSGLWKDLAPRPGKGGKEEKRLPASACCQLRELPPPAGPTRSSQPQKPVAGGEQEVGTGPSGSGPCRL